MKKEYWAIALIVVGFLVYTRLSRPVSEEERQVQGYEDRFEAARNKFLSAARSLAMPGESAIADPDAAVRRLKTVKADFDLFYESLTEEAALARADKLAEEIERFFEANDIE